jgi:hypothetical protein
MIMENEEIILGYQWSPETKKYIGEYRFPNNKDKDKIHLPPFTTLTKPPETEKESAAYWNGDEWFTDVNPDIITEHPPIDDYELLMPEYIDYLKSNDLWTVDDENKRQEALDNIEKRRIEEEKKQEEEENNKDYLQLLKNIRNQFLMQSDWTQLPDVQLTEEQKESWRIYRQKLRDLPENVEDPKALVLDENHPDWPIAPI